MFVLVSLEQHVPAYWVLVISRPENIFRRQHWHIHVSMNRAYLVRKAREYGVAIARKQSWDISAINNWLATHAKHLQVHYGDNALVLYYDGNNIGQFKRFDALAAAIQLARCS